MGAYIVYVLERNSRQVIIALCFYLETIVDHGQNVQGFIGSNRGIKASLVHSRNIIRLST